MSKPKDLNQLIIHKNNAVECVNNYLLSLINTKSEKLKGKADKFSYWLEDYIKFLTFESSFKSESLKRYKRGEILKAHLGYNIGSEEGGLHFVVVLDNDNSIYSPVITVLPLTSIKNDKDLNNLKKGEVNLGNELFSCLSSKVSLLRKSANEQLELLTKQIESPDFISDSAELRDELKKLELQYRYIIKTQQEISKLKIGSIGLVNQITTISKIRIYDPKTSEDVFSGIKLSNLNLDKIDRQICAMFTKNKTLIKNMHK